MLTRENVVDVYPLTGFQEGLLYRDLIERQATEAQAPGGARAYAMQMCFRLHGPLRVEAFEQAWQALVDRHDILRTAFPARFKDRPLQVVLRQCPLKLQTLEAGGLEWSDRAAALAEHASRLREQAFDLERPPLMRVACLRFAEDDHGIIWDFHHILLDGWCIGLIQQELAALYAAACEGTAPRLARPLPYGRYVAWLEQQRKASQAAAWAACLSGAPTKAPALPGRTHRADGVHTRRPRSQTRHLDGPDLQRLQSLAAAERCTVGDALYALWGGFLGRVVGSSDLIFGSVRSLRPASLPGSQELVGPCIGMLPVRVNVPAGATLSDLLAAMAPQRELWRSQSADPLPDILRAAGLPSEVVGHFLVFENYPALDGADGAQQPLSHGVTMSGWAFWALNDYEFFVRVTPAAADGLRIDFEFDAQAFDEGTMASLADSFATFVGDACRRPEVPIERLAWLDAVEHEKLTLNWPRGRAPRGVADGFGALWQALLDRQGDQPALRWSGGQFRYGELHAAAARVATALKAHGARPGEVVALAADPGPWMVTGMLACALLGMPFLPLDPQWPDGHRRRVLSDSGARWRFGPIPDAWQEDPGVIDVAAPPLETPGHAETLAEGNASFAPDPAATAYLIYTSGTTGDPKGVAVGMRSVLNYTAWLQADLGIGPDSASALLTSAAYDLGYTALFGTLFNGGCLTVLDEDERRDPDIVVKRIVEHGLTFLKATPSYFSLLQSCEAWQSLDPAAHRLQRILLGGEAQDFDALNRLRRQHPQIRIHNHYGPTEATIGCISGALDGPEGPIGSPHPLQILGRPIPGAQVLITDAALQPVPVGVVGEVLLGGEILAQGYRGQAAAAASQRFIQSPFSPGQRLYRTGDLAAWSADGRVIFHGRRDDQVKVQGYRVNLADIAAAIRQLDGVRDAAVLLEGAGTSQSLCAFVVCDEGAEPLGPSDERCAGVDAAAVNPQVLREGLRRVLPRALIPGRWLSVPEIPLTANGKVDRGQLWATARPASEEGAPGDRDAQAGPDHDSLESSPVLEPVLKAFREVLQLESIRPTDDFFALGGHSLKAIRLTSALRRALDRPVPIGAIFEYPRARDLARWLSARKAADASSPELAGIRLLAAAPQPALDVVFLPALTGSSSLFQGLAERLSSGPLQARCWGLDCIPAQADDPVPASLSELGLSMARVVAGSVPPKPLLLVGWSFGAHLACETARSLQAMQPLAAHPRATGQAPERLRVVLLDIPPPDGPLQAPGSAQPPGSPPAPTPTPTPKADPLPVERIQEIARAMGLEMTADEAHALAPNLRRHMNLLDTHRLAEPLACDLLLLEARDSTPPTGMQAWKDWTRGQAVHRMLDGDHHGMVTDRHQADLAATITDWAAQAH